MMQHPRDPSAIDQLSRRRFLSAAASGAVAGGLWSSRQTFAQQAEPETGGKPRRLKRIAAINSVYRIRSHAYHIAGRFVHGYRREGFHHQPPFKLARMFNDQYPAGDMSRDLCRKYDIELADTVAGALGDNGGLDVDGVLLIVEHGDYPENQFGQKLYPRFELFQQIVEVFRKNGRAVPVFNDKHLSYDHRQAAQMVAWSRELKFPFMAGSSLPVTWRRPDLEPPLGTPLTEGLACYGGSLEHYFFHALEALQCMLERRQGGETGVKTVECLEGDAVWKAGDAGRWSWKLLDAALARSPSCNYGDVRDNVATPYAILIEYRDGTRGCVLNLSEHISDFNFAGAIRGREQPVSTCFYLPAPPGAKYFDALTYNIERMFATGKPSYPVERTLLTSTVLDLAMHSLAEGGKPHHSDALDIRYTAPHDSGYFRGRYTEAG
ncbi:MAG: twin-arginine translocation signal domain-containing protein [Pirellulaceae bacterium]